jgi:hypothetical protein
VLARASTVTGESEAWFDHAGLADFYVFFHPLVTAEQDSVLFVFFHLPAIGWMDLFDVNDAEINVIFRPGVNLVRASRLGANGRSGIASNDQPHWAIAEASRQPTKRRRWRNASRPCFCDLAESRASIRALINQRTPR